MELHGNAERRAHKSNSARSVELLPSRSVGEQGPLIRCTVRPESGSAFCLFSAWQPSALCSLRDGFSYCLQMRQKFLFTRARRPAVLGGHVAYIANENFIRCDKSPVEGMRSHRKLRTTHKASFLSHEGSALLLRAAGPQDQRVLEVSQTWAHVAFSSEVVGRVV